MQAAHLLERHIGAGRIVGIGEEHDVRARRDGGQDGVDVGALIGLLDRYRDGTCRLDIDLVDHEAVFGEDRLVAGRQIGLRQQAEDLVGAVGADDVLCVEAMHLGDRFAQPPGGAVGIDVELSGNLPRGFDRLRRGPKRILVRRQLVDLGDAGRRRALARHIGVDVHDARARGWTCLIRCLLHFEISIEKGSRQEPQRKYKP